MYWTRRNEALSKLYDAKIEPLDPYCNARNQATLDAMIKLCAHFILPYVRSGRLIYIGLYDHEDQSGPAGQYHGVCCTFRDGTAVIGIAIDALHWSRNYAMLTLLHEIAHLEIDGHPPAFKAHLNGLIDRFNRATGRHVVNDIR